MVFDSLDTTIISGQSPDQWMVGSNASTCDRAPAVFWSSWSWFLCAIDAGTASGRDMLCTFRLNEGVGDVDEGVGEAVDRAIAGEDQYLLV